MFNRVKGAVEKVRDTAGTVAGSVADKAKDRARRHSSTRKKVTVEIPAIELELVSGTGLLAADKNGTSDPYVRIFAGNYKYRSKVKSRTLDPKWNQTFYLEETSDTILFEVYDKDTYDRDDFLGWCELDASVLEDEQVHEFDLELYTKKKEQNETHGSIKVSMLKTVITADKLSAKKARRKYAKLAGKRRLIVDLVEARNLLISDDDGFSDPYVKFRVGKARPQKSRVVFSNLNPVYNQRFEFDFPEGSDELLYVQVYDRDLGINNDDLIGEVEIDFHEFETNRRVDDWYRLAFKRKGEKSQEAGWIKLGLTVLEMGRPIVINTNNKVTVEIIKARNMKPVDNAFVEVELANSLMYTDRVAARESPKWESLIELPVNDVYQDLQITVYDGDYDDKRFLGRVMIPLLSIQSKQKEYYVLKSEDCLHRVVGEIQLALDVKYSPLSPYLNLIKRHDKVNYEAKLETQKGGLVSGVKTLNKKVKKVRAHAKRLSKLIADVKALIAPVLYVINWKDIPTSLFFMIMWVPFCLLFRTWMLVGAAASYLFYNYYFNNESPKYKVDENGFYRAEFVDDGKNAAIDFQFDEEDDDDEDDDEDLEDDEERESRPQKEEKKSPGMKSSAIKSAVKYANIAETNLDFIASIGERVENLVNWSVPQITRVFAIGFTSVTVILLFVPVNIFIMVVGLGYHSFKFYKFHIKKKKTEKQKLRKPSNELINMILRLPTHEKKIQRSRYRPEDVTIKKSRMSQKLERN